MPLPLAHALVGGTISVALWPERTPAGFRRALVVGSLLGMCPDADYLLSRLRVLGWGWHHGFTHSVVFAVIVGATVRWALGLRGWRGALACMLPVLSHVVLDYLVTESPGVALWWPVTGRRTKLGIDALSYYHIVEAPGRALAVVKLCVVEILLFGPILVGTVLASRRRFRAQDDSPSSSPRDVGHRQLVAADLSAQPAAQRNQGAQQPHHECQR